MPGLRPTPGRPRRPAPRPALACLLLAVAGAACTGAAARPAPAAPPAPTSRALQRPPIVRPATPAAPHRQAGPTAPPGRPVPVVMYHVIGVAPAGAPFPGLYVAPDVFRAELAALAAARYHPVTLDAVWRYWHGGTLPARPVVLTFDDGYRGDYSVAMPALWHRRWPAVLDLLVANLHRHGWGLRTWEVRRMVAHGWQIASHTLTHPDLTTLGPIALRREVAASRAVLRRLFGQPVAWFCYPLGRVDPTVVRAVRAAGYVGGLTEVPGLATRRARWLEPRIRVDASTTPAELVAAVADAGGVP